MSERGSRRRSRLPFFCFVVTPGFLLCDECGCGRKTPSKWAVEGGRCGTGFVFKDVSAFSAKEKGAGRGGVVPAAQASPPPFVLWRSWFALGLFCFFVYFFSAFFFEHFLSASGWPSFIFLPEKRLRVSFLLYFP